MGSEKGELTVSGKLIRACAVVLGCMVFWGSFNPYLRVYLFIFYFKSHREFIKTNFFTLSTLKNKFPILHSISIFFLKMEAGGGIQNGRFHCTIPHVLILSHPDLLCSSLNTLIWQIGKYWNGVNPSF